MRVLHVTAAGPNSGAGSAAILTHQALIREGKVNSRILFLTDEQVSEADFYSFESGIAFRKLQRLTVTYLDRLPLALYPRRRRGILFSPGFLGQQIRRHDLYEWADIIHLHWINHGFISIREISKWEKPVVWSLRDMWAFTGGCHHSLGCDRFTKGCGRCPALGSSSAGDLSAIVLRRKKHYLGHSGIRWVAISRWLNRAARSSELLRTEFLSTVHSGIRTDLFTILERVEARSRLGISLGARVVLIGAADLADTYKGTDHMIKVLRRVDPALLVIAFGRSATVSLDVPQEVIRLGYVDGSGNLETVYNCADVYLAPALNEAFGKTVAEAQSCGVPVVAFDDTGPADIVEHLKTGYLATHGDEEDLNRGLNYCLTRKFDRTYIRDRTVTLFDISESARKYLAIYESFASSGF